MYIPVRGCAAGLVNDLYMGRILTDFSYWAICIRLAIRLNNLERRYIIFALLRIRVKRLKPYNKNTSGH